MVLRVSISFQIIFFAFCLSFCSTKNEIINSGIDEALLVYQQSGGMDIYSAGDNVGFSMTFDDSGYVYHKELTAKTARPLRIEADSVNYFKLSQEQKNTLDEFVKNDELQQELSEIKQRMASKTDFIGPSQSVSISLRDLDSKTLEKVSFSMDALEEDEDQEVIKLINWVRSIKS